MPASLRQVRLGVHGALVVNVLSACDTAVRDPVLSVTVGVEHFESIHEALHLIVVVELLLDVLHLAASVGGHHLLAVVLVHPLFLTVIVITAPDLVVLVKVDHITLSLSEVAVVSELTDTKLLDDLEDVKLLVEHLLALSKELVLSPLVLPAAEAPWTGEVLKDEKPPGAVGEWLPVSQLCLEGIHVLTDLWLDSILLLAGKFCVASIACLVEVPLGLSLLLPLLIVIIIVRVLAVHTIRVELLHHGVVK